MAKIKFGMFMTDARGKVGGHVFSKNRSGAYVRTKVTPSNMRSARQTFIRAALARISANWSTLTDQQRASFNGAVNAWATTNIFGDATNPTGKTLFTKLNLNLANAGLPEIVEAPQKQELPPFLVTTVGIDTGLMPMELEGNSVNARIIVAATPQLSAGTSFYKGKFRQISVVPGSAAVSIDVYNAYVDKFGEPDVTANIAFSVHIVLPNGQASIPQVIKAAEL